MTHLRHIACAACGRSLSTGCRIGTLEDFEPDCEERTSPVPAGVMVVLPDPAVLSVHHPDGTIGERLVSSAGAISVNPVDVPKKALKRSGINNGCCDSDGCDGPNRSCRCGQVVAIQWADCWTRAEVRFLKEAVVVR